MSGISNDVKTNKANTFTKLNTFNNVAPQTPITPSNNDDLVNKKYIDDLEPTIEGIHASALEFDTTNGSFTLSQTNTGTAAPSISVDLDGRYGTLTQQNTNTANIATNTEDIATNSASIATNATGLANCVLKTGFQTISGNKSFSGNLQSGGLYVGDIGTLSGLKNASVGDSNTGYCILQDTAGQTFINAADSKEIFFKIGNNQSTNGHDGMKIGTDGVVVCQRTLQVIDESSATAAQHRQNIMIGDANGAQYYKGFSTTNDSYIRCSGFGSSSKQGSTDYCNLAAYNIYHAGSLIPSDYRLKHNKEEIPNALEIISELKPYKYQKTDQMVDISGENWRWEIGLIAQNIQDISYLNFCVRDDTPYTDNRLSLDYNHFIGLLVQGVKDLNTENNSLKERITLIESKLSSVDISNASQENETETQNTSKAEAEANTEASG